MPRARSWWLGTPKAHLNNKKDITFLCSSARPGYEELGE